VADGAEPADGLACGPRGKGKRGGSEGGKRARGGKEREKWAGLRENGLLFLFFSFFPFSSLHSNLQTNII
jgi:hypothetical protein